MAESNKVSILQQRSENRICPDMSVREISLRYPACRNVFARHGMGGCGGELGPDEPLEFFAEAHRVDLSCLMVELERAAREELPNTITAALDFEKKLARLYKSFVRAAIGLFGVSIWRTLNRRQQVLVAENQITPKTHLRWLLDNFPEAREELIRAGLRHLAKVNSPPSFVTLEQAASIHGLEAEDLVQRLSTILRPPPSPPATAEARHLPSAPSEIRKGS